MKLSDFSQEKHHPHNKRHLKLEDDESVQQSFDDLELEDETENNKSEDWNKEDDNLDNSRL